jgi:hypothetical protein
VEDEGTRQERREEKLHKEREKVRQHGRSLVRVYKDATLKRAARRRRKKA